jgi:hypothetical protein
MVRRELHFSAETRSQSFESPGALCGTHSLRSLLSNPPHEVVVDPGWVSTDMGGATAPAIPDVAVAGFIRSSNDSAPTLAIKTRRSGQALWTPSSADVGVGTQSERDDARPAPRSHGEHERIVGWSRVGVDPAGRPPGRGDARPESAFCVSSSYAPRRAEDRRAAHRRSPGRAHRVPGQQRVGAEHHQPVDDGLAGQHPVERVPVKRGEAREMERRFLVQG